MNLFTVDFETFYSTDYTLKGMSTEDYVNDPRFEIIMVSLKKNNEPVQWFSGTMDETLEWLDEQGLYEGAMLCHNAMFDALILAVHAGRLPKVLMDTRLMAQAVLKPYMSSVSLDACLKHIDVGIQKGDAVHNMKGRTRLSLSKQELKEYANYCMTDTEGTYRLFKYLAPTYPREELRIIDMTLRMYLQPRLELDADLLAELLNEAKAKKQKLIDSLPAGVTEKILGSNTKFAELLSQLGVEVPMKVSPTTGQLTYAFAKTDPGFKEMEEMYEDDPVISAILAARIGSKSTIEESRCERMLEIATNYLKFRIPLLYYGAHTGRYGGMEKINPQNMPRIDKSRLRFAVRAPKGSVIIGLDLAQIEARITAWLARCKPLTVGFARKEDIYSQFATIAFKAETIKGRSKEDDRRRFVGKTCILGLGFGMSAEKLKNTLRKDGVKMELPETMRLVETYRGTYWQIPLLWQDIQGALTHAKTSKGRVDFRDCLRMVEDGIILPNGMTLHYYRLRHRKATKEGEFDGWVYDFGRETRTVWGGKITENVVQALARIVVMEQMLRIERELGVRPALQVHDELDYVVPEKDAETFARDASAIMRTPPTWAPDLPVDVEAHWGPTFGDCK